MSDTERKQEDANTPDSLEGERGMPDVNETRPTARRGLAVAFVVVALLITGLFIYLTLGKTETGTGIVDAPQKTASVNSVPDRTFTLPPKPTPPPEPKKSVEPTKSEIKPSNSGQPQGKPPALPGKSENSLATIDKSASSLMTPLSGGNTGGAGTSSGSIRPAGSGAVDLANAGAGGGNGGSSGLDSFGGSSSSSDGQSLGSRLSGTKTSGASASMLGNRNFILAKGSYIQCVLDTKLDTTVPGQTKCTIARNIYSDNGKVLLVERGSTVSGEYKSNMQQGQGRIFVLWTRIKTPDGVVINLNSSGTDSLGGGGIPGHVDNHFWQRFGGAILLSVISDAGQALANTASGSSGDTTVQFGNTSQATQQMAAEALRNTINIPPTLSKNHGDLVGIYVSRDLNFSSVYDVRASE